MTNQEAIKWLNMYASKPIRWGNYSDDTKTIREKAEAYIQEAFNMAIDVLKAQEPHVMTLEEYEAWIDTPFTERNPVFHEERTKRGTVTCWVNTIVCTLSEYGKNDRCWTSRPTAEQREAIPWHV